MPYDSQTIAFLQLVDRLDAEANAVTHAVMTAQLTIHAVLDSSQALVGDLPIGERAMAEIGVQFMQQRAALLESLAAIRSLGQSRGNTESNVTVGVPIPPRPTRRYPEPHAIRTNMPSGLPVGGDPAPGIPPLALPVPPRLRNLRIAILPALARPTRKASRYSPTRAGLGV